MPAAPLPPVYTIGHSTHLIAEFVELLRFGEVEEVVDIRTVPRSRANPQYNLDVLPAALAAYKIGHRHLAALGGLRKKTPGVAPEVNALWRNDSFHRYADYALTPAFAEGLRELLDLAAVRRCAVMCAEAVWWRCHRRIVADHLLLRGRTVLHLMAPHRAEPASLTPGAVARGERLTYPAGEAALAPVADESGSGIIN